MRTLSGSSHLNRNSRGSRPRVVRNQRLGYGLEPKE
ncbi:hypothetical protein FHY06_001186 [Variovorax sp. BK613]|nr:hypothetical protein [Variovorax sp. BK613]